MPQNDQLLSVLCFECPYNTGLGGDAQVKKPLKIATSVTLTRQGGDSHAEMQKPILAKDDNATSGFAEMQKPILAKVKLSC